MSEREGLAALLASAGFDDPNGNVCASCGHHGGDHDLGNWCLICPRPDEWDRTAKSPTGAKCDAGWCYFSSMTAAERWQSALDLLLAAGVRVAPSPTEMRRVQVYDGDGEVVLEVALPTADSVRLVDFLRERIDDDVYDDPMPEGFRG